MNVLNSLIVLSSITLMSCSWLNPPIQVDCKPIERTPLALQSINPLQPKPVEWFVITADNSNEVFRKLQNKKYNLVLFGLTDDGYKNISMNNSEFRAYVIKQNAIIAGYKKYYEPQIFQETNITAPKD